MRLNNKHPYAVLCLIFIVNFLFKLIYLSSPSLWYDEIISAQDTLLNFGHIKHEAEWDKNPPFYHYILWLWCKVFGISELGLRSMSVFFSSLTAVLIYSLGSKISNKRNAIAATVIFTLHPFLYYYAQEARCFSFLIFLTTINLILTYCLIQNPKLFKAFLLGVLNFLIFYTHYLAGLILLCQFIYLLVVFRRKWLYLLLIYITPILLVLIRFTKKQYLVLFFSHEMSKEKNNVPLSKWENLLEYLNDLFVSKYLAILFALIFVIFLIRFFKEKNLSGDSNLQFKLFVVASPLICILTLYLVGKITNVFHSRYLLFVLPYIFFSFCIFAENKIGLYSVTLALLLLEITGLRFNQSKKMDYKFVAFLTKEIQKKEDIYMLIQTHDVVTLFTYYYDREIFESKDKMSKEFLAKKKIYYIDNLEDLKRIKFEENKPILFLQTYQKPGDELAMHHYFKSQKYFTFTTNQIEGVKVTYLKR